MEYLTKQESFMIRGFQVLFTIWLCFFLFSCAPNQTQPKDEPSVVSKNEQPKKSVSVEKGVELTLTAKKPGEGTIEVNQGLIGVQGNYPRSIEQGLEVSFSFENKTKEPAENHIIASKDAKLSEVVIIEDSKEIAPVAMKFDGDKAGYRTLDVPAGIVIGGCEDNPPAAAQKDGKTMGLITVFCTKPDERDTVTVMFSKGSIKTTGEITVKVKCKLCPKEGLQLKAMPE
jgi:hypothetical protein